MVRGVDVGIFCSCRKCICASSVRNAQSTRQPEHSLSELSHIDRLETNPRCSGIRSQPDEISSARHAPVGELHGMSRQAGFYQRWTQLPGLSRRHSQAPVGSQLRAMPHRPGMASLHSAGAAAQQPLSADWGARYGRLRCLPQRSGHQQIPDDAHAVLLMPLRGIQNRLNSKPRRRGFFYHLRELP